MSVFKARSDHIQDQMGDSQQNLSTAISNLMLQAQPASPTGQHHINRDVEAHAARPFQDLYTRLVSCPSSEGLSPPGNLSCLSLQVDLCAPGFTSYATCVRTDSRPHYADLFHPPPGTDTRPQRGQVPIASQGILARHAHRTLAHARDKARPLRKAYN